MDARSKVKVTKEQKTEMINRIKSFHRREKGEELSDLAADIWLSFFIEELAPYFYNQGVEDSHHYMGERVEDLLSIQKVH